MKKQIQDLQSKNISELEKEVQTLQSEIAKLALEKGINPEKDTNLISKKKQRIAVLQTVLTAKRNK